MLDLVLGGSFIVIGTAILGNAESLVQFEVRLANRHKWTRLSKWTGTRRHLWAWRIAGILFLFVGLISSLGGYLELFVWR